MSMQLADRLVERYRNRFSFLFSSCRADINVRDFDILYNMQSSEVLSSFEDSLQALHLNSNANEAEARDDLLKYIQQYYNKMRMEIARQSRERRGHEEQDVETGLATCKRCGYVFHLANNPEDACQIVKAHQYHPGSLRTKVLHIKLMLII
jgi:hypothetical protein